MPTQRCSTKRSEERRAPLLHAALEAQPVGRSASKAGKTVAPLQAARHTPG